METMQNSSCGCQEVIEEPISEENECCSSSSDCDYACNKLSDPEWIKGNMEYFPAGFAAKNGIFKDISPKETHQMIQEHKQDNTFIILDVKTKQEYLKIHLTGSMSMDFFSKPFKDDLFLLDKNKTYIVICKVGIRSGIAMNLMKKMGFKEVYNVLGGDDRWIAEEIPYD